MEHMPIVSGHEQEHAMSHSADAPKYVFAEKKIFAAIEQAGSFQVYAESLPHLEKAFTEASGACTCIDEGNTEGEVRIAGAGILHPGGASAVAEILCDAGITKVHAHEGCGAAGAAYELAFKRKGSPTEVDNFAKRHVTSVIEEMNKIYEKAGNGKIAQAQFTFLSEMNRPAETHDARVIYYDTVGKFNPTKVAGLPKGFVVSRSHFNDGHAEANVDKAIGIAFGHGFGITYFKQHPLRIVLVGKNDAALDKAEAELAAIVSRYNGDEKTCVVFERLSKPTEQTN